LIYILDKLHEELKDIYVSNEEDNYENLNNGEWNETGEKN
jgi:hypothetical protein